ncbi:hypothetical protein KL86APRO_11428 [uncultured Alphaproteobacteria bacterium]|uniref:Glycosyltransferase 2-like domain-containing protein n=1 Tax=uncultured Alphaproteobacteria bacterium TaxID=91750 RepID=A0A212JPQ7_9PROT|nr:hypothetical protein KL86APRO_11428 [uncultured Alphaproteobacteria bacterium]
MTPLALFCYARPEHTCRTVEALMANRRADEIALTVFCDGPRDSRARPKVAETRAAVHALLDASDAFGAIAFVERDENLGLTRSILGGIGHLLETADQVIVIEDDIVTAPGFLDYALSGLDAYRDDPRIATIGGYVPGAVSAAIPSDYRDDVFFSPRNTAWGWATWRDRWQTVDYTLADYPAFKNDLPAQLAFNTCGDDVTQMLYFTAERGLNTWDVQSTYAFFRQSRLTVLPCRSLVENIGLDGTGEHCATAPAMAVNLAAALGTHRFPAEVTTDDRILSAFRKLFARQHPGLIGGGAAAYWAAARGDQGLRRLVLAADSFARGDIEKARLLLDIHLDRVPGDPEALTLIGEIALAVGAFEPAADVFRSALLAWADHEAANRGLVRALNRSTAPVA